MARITIHLEKISKKVDFDYGFKNNVSDIEYLKVIKYECLS